MKKIFLFFCLASSLLMTSGIAGPISVTVDLMMITGLFKLASHAVG